MEVKGIIVVYHVLLAFNVYMDAAMKEMRMRMERRGLRFQEMTWFCVSSRKKT